MNYHDFSKKVINRATELSKVRASKRSYEHMKVIHNWFKLAKKRFKNDDLIRSDLTYKLLIFNYW